MLIGAVSLVKGRVREVGLVMQDVMNLLEPRMASAAFLVNAPFKTVHLIIRFGDKTDLEVEYQPINKRDMELPVAVQLELAPLRMASREVALAAILQATTAVLADISKRYGLPPLDTTDLTAAR